MRRIRTAALLVAAATAIWIAVFFATAYAAVRVVEAIEGDTSECWSAQCGKLGEFQTNHDLLAVVGFALLAALPAAAFLWLAWPRFAKRFAKAS